VVCGANWLNASACYRSALKRLMALPLIKGATLQLIKIGAAAHSADTEKLLVYLLHGLRPYPQGAYRLEIISARWKALIDKRPGDRVCDVPDKPRLTIHIKSLIAIAILPFILIAT